MTYAIKDLTDEETKERFYEPELQLIVKEDNVSDVEKVLRTKRRNGQLDITSAGKAIRISLILGWTHAASTQRTLEILRIKIPRRNK